MDSQEFTTTVQSAHETALSRLGSSKWIYALTGGEMSGESVETAWAAEAGAARETFTAWADAETNDDAAATFEAAASTLAADSSDDARPMYETLAALDDTASRAGGLLAWTLVTEKTLTQMVGFFVGDADPGTANTFREHKGDAQSLRESAATLLDAVCTDDATWEAARDGADRVVEAAYDDYVETLESMGIKPKNVC